MSGRPQEEHGCQVRATWLIVNSYYLVEGREPGCYGVFAPPPDRLQLASGIRGGGCCCESLLLFCLVNHGTANRDAQQSVVPKASCKRLDRTPVHAKLFHKRHCVGDAWSNHQCAKSNDEESSSCATCSNTQRDRLACSNGENPLR